MTVFLIERFVEERQHVHRRRPPLWAAAHPDWCTSGVKNVFLTGLECGDWKTVVDAGGAVVVMAGTIREDGCTFFDVGTVYQFLKDLI